MSNKTQDNKSGESALIAARHQKMGNLVAAGVEPYARDFHNVNHIGEIKPQYEYLEADTGAEAEVKVAGRIMARRGMGKAGFADIEDLTGRMQIYAKKDELGENYPIFKRMDVGDIVGVTGQPFRTKMGELSIRVTNIQHLSKSLRPLPEKWHGLKDVEIRYRRRYVDLIMNPESRDRFIKRSQIIRVIREMLYAKDFLEVETPMMQPIPGGAAARPFVTHHNALDMELFLRIAPELYLKRLIVGGLERVFEINRSFRNEGISIKHNPEFTMLELYQAFVNYEDIARLVEEMLRRISEEVCGAGKIAYGEEEIDFASPFRRVRMVDIILEMSGIDVMKLSRDELAAELKKRGVEVKPFHTHGHLINALFEETCEAALIHPTFVMDYPVEITPLCRQCSYDERFVERFELFIGGREIANAYSELADPVEQRRRFQAQMAERDAGDDEAQLMDQDYVEALEYGMPPCGGLGIGIDRLAMFFTDAPSIRDVILFPTMKPIKEGNADKQEEEDD